MSRVRYLRLGMLVFLSSALTVACSERTPLQSGQQGADWRPLYAAWSHPDPIPDFQLTDQDGHVFRLSERFSGHVLVGFIFSRCAVPTACPMTMEKMRQVQIAWADHGLRAPERTQQLQLLSLTLDPSHDTPQILRAYGTDHHADFKSWTLATGDKELLSEALPSLFNVMALPDPKLTFKHTVKVALVGPDRRVLKSWNDNGFNAAVVMDAMADP